MNITKLDNPFTSSFYDLEKVIKSYDLLWNNMAAKNDSHPAFLSHTVIARPSPEIRFPKEMSPHIELVNNVVNEIFDYNKVPVNCILRINFNLCYPTGVSKQTPWHTDHHFPHINMLVYFSDSDGELLVRDEKHTPKNGDIVMFPGSIEHCINTPTVDPRYAMVVTFM